MHRYNRKENNTEDCLNRLKADGYKIVATLPAEKDISLPEIDINQPLAIVFGNEKEGLSPKVKEMADICMKIPMYGFTESYNISVSAAITMYTLSEKVLPRISATPKKKFFLVRQKNEEGNLSL